MFSKPENDDPELNPLHYNKAFVDDSLHQTRRAAVITRLIAWSTVFCLAVVYIVGYVSLDALLLQQDTRVLALPWQQQLGILGVTVLPLLFVGGLFSLAHTQHQIAPLRFIHLNIGDAVERGIYRWSMRDYETYQKAIGYRCLLVDLAKEKEAELQVLQEYEALAEQLMRTYDNQDQTLKKLAKIRGVHQRMAELGSYLAVTMPTTCPDTNAIEFPPSLAEKQEALEEVRVELAAITAIAAE